MPPRINKDKKTGLKHFVAEGLDYYQVDQEWLSEHEATGGQAAEKLHRLLGRSGKKTNYRLLGADPNEPDKYWVGVSKNDA